MTRRATMPEQRRLDGHCAACTRCSVDATGCCVCGGPFNDQLIHDKAAFIPDPDNAKAEAAQ